MKHRHPQPLAVRAAAVAASETAAAWETSFSGPHSDQLKLTERFTRIDPEMIDYRICVEDPAT